MPNPHGSYIWYRIQTLDPDATKAFYDKVVGWNIGPKPDGEMDYRMIVAPDGHVGGVMRLTDEMQAKGARPGWLGYIGVDDVDAAVARLEEAGGTVLKPAWDIPDVGRLAMVADPEGVPFFLIRGASEEASEAFKPMANGHVAWNELATSDQAGALAFYGGLFGWTSDQGMPMGEMGEYKFLEHDGQMIGAVMTRPADGPPPGWTFYFRVPDVDAAADHIRSGGGAVHFGPAEVPGGDHVVVATDPHGAMFGVVGARRGEG